MIGHVIQVDKYIIQIYHNTDIQKIGEKVIYELLKDHKSIGKTKGHYKLFEWSVTYSKSGFIFIIIGNANQVLSTAKIYLYIYSSFARWVQ